MYREFLQKNYDKSQLISLKISLDADEYNSKYFQMYIGFLLVVLVTVSGYMIKALLDSYKLLPFLIITIIICVTATGYYALFLKKSRSIVLRKELVKQILESRFPINAKNETKENK